MKPQLLKIKAHLEKLLADAKLRTAGKWRHDGPWFPQPPHGDGIHSFYGVGTPEKLVIQRCYTETDARYIASCAGNAEAGWRSTLVAIDALLEISKWKFENTQYAQAAMQSIIAEWEGLV